MLSLCQYALLNKIKEQSLKIPRDDMPQIFGKNHCDFKKYLHDNKVTYFDQTISPDHLKATQNQFNTDKVEHLMHTPAPSDYSIFISSDKYVVDGHHRWLAALLSGEKLIKVIEINLPIQQLLVCLHSYDKVGYKTVKESIIRP